MTRTLTFAACAALLAMAGPAAAQTAAGARTPPASSAGPTDPASPATGSAVNSSATTGAPAGIVSGMSVKDNTGALIGEITAVKPDASGQDLATIKMGTDTFTVETSKLGTANGVATINASQAELKKMLPKR